MIQTLFQAQDGSELRLERRSTMFALTTLTKYAGVGALVLGGLSLPAGADELAQNLGPVGPHEPILTTLGSKRVIAFYEPNSGHCAMHIVLWNTADAEANSVARVRMTLNPRQIVHVDNVENKSLNLQCGSNAETLSLVDNDELVAFGITSQQSDQSMKASASGF
jgi:hypothetical protein